MKDSLVQNCVQLILILNDVLIDWRVHAAGGNTVAHRAIFGHSQCEILGVRNDTALAGRVASGVRVDRYRYIETLHTNKGDILQNYGLG